MSGSEIFKSAVASQYDRHVGRYNSDLARALIAFAGVKAGESVLDVGCGPGALSAELVKVVGAEHVHAVDPSPAFVEAFRGRLPAVEAQMATAEDLPFPEGTFDHTIAQLVVNYMTDAVAGVGEMSRVTGPGGRVSAATWDYSYSGFFLRTFWDAARAVTLVAAAFDEAAMFRYCTGPELERLWRDAGLVNIRVEAAHVSARYTDFDDLWQPLEAGIGPSGLYVQALDDERRDALEMEYRRILGVADQPFELPARAWMVTGEVSEKLP